MYGSGAWTRLLPNVENQNQSWCHCKPSTCTIYAKFLIHFYYGIFLYYTTLTFATENLEVANLVNVGILIHSFWGLDRTIRDRFWANLATPLATTTTTTQNNLSRPCVLNLQCALEISLRMLLPKPSYTCPAALCSQKIDG